MIQLELQTRWQRTKARRKELLQQRRAALIEALGGVCVECRTTERLEFDHTEPREWIASKKNQETRQRFYEREAAAGKIVLRCRVCNVRKGAPQSEPELDDNGNPIDPLEEPF